MNRVYPQALVEQEFAMIHVLLTDGPVDLAPEVELPGLVPPPQLTMDFRGWHQHFEHTGSFRTVGDRTLPVYQWRYRTAIAE